MGLRSPPFSIEAEQSVLGGLILDNRQILEVRSRVTEGDFYRADHQLIFGAICELEATRRPADFITLVEHLRARNLLEDAGGISYLGSLANDTPSSANATAYADIVRERALLRSLIAAGSDIQSLGYNPDGRDGVALLSVAQKLVMDIQSANDNGEPRLIGDDIAAWSQEFYARQRDNKPPGLQTGFRAIDQELTGLEAGDLIIPAGATGMGKTVFGLTVAEHIARTAGPVLGISLEMPRRQWLSRLVASRASIPLRHLRDPRQMDALYEDQITRALSEINRLPFYVDDTSGLTIHHIRTRAMRLHRRVGLKFMLVDYLQLVTGERRQSDTRTNEMDSVSRGLKALAKELGIPIMALAQINNKVTERDTKRPRLSDLRESGGITQDADVVLGLYRDEYYHRESPHRGVVEVITLKQRNGDMDTVDLAWEGGFCRMSDYHGPDYKARQPALAKKKTGLAGALP